MKKALLEKLNGKNGDEDNRIWRCEFEFPNHPKINMYEETGSLPLFYKQSFCGIQPLNYLI